MQNNIEDAIEATIPSDSNWQNLGYGSGYQSPSFGFAPQYRKIGKQMYKDVCSGKISSEEFAKWVDEQDK